MKLARIKKSPKIDPRTIEFNGGACTECGHEVYTSAYSSIVMCPKCDTQFAIEVPRAAGYTTVHKLPKDMPTI